MPKLMLKLKLKPKPLALAAMLTCLHAAAVAQPDAAPLDQVTVEADKVTQDVPATLSVITREDIQQRGARTIRDVLAEEPDVVVRLRPSNFSATRSSGGRARSEGINVRGIEGNRLLIVQDGIRLPSSFSFGPAFQTGRGDYWDVDSFRKIEILRGPNSTQYGADSIAGVVSATSLQVDDLVKAGRTVGGFGQGAYAQQDNSFNHSAGIGYDDGRWQGMFMGSTRSGHETWSQEQDRQPNSNRTAPNPMNVESRYYLGRAGLRLDASHRVQVTLENLNTVVDTDGLTAVFPYPEFKQTRSLTAHDTTKRQRTSLEHFYQGPEQGWLTQLHSHLYWQQAGTRQFTHERVFDPSNPGEALLVSQSGGFSIATAPGALQRTRDNSYVERTIGLSMLAEGRLLAGAFEHRLRYGFDLSRADISAVLDGTAPTAGKVFPARPAPDTAYTTSGLFVQDEIVFGGLHVIPGLRYDRYRLAPDARSLSAADKQEILVSNATLSGSRSASAWTPRLGVIWKIAPAFAPYFNYAKGFRAPEPGQVNANYSNTTARYEVVGNPDLRPERVTSKELGVRGRVGGFSYSAAGFDSRYTDFIELQRVGLTLPTFHGVHRSVNFSQAHVRGLEARAEWKPAPAWRFNAAWAYTRGDVYRPKWVGFNPDFSFIFAEPAWQPLNSVQPMRAILGASYRQERWGAYVNLEHSWGKTPDRVTPARAQQSAYRTSSSAFTVVGAGAHVKPTPGMTLSLNVENLFNATYERWSDVGELEIMDRRYTAPPRSLQLSLRYAF